MSKSLKKSIYRINNILNEFDIKDIYVIANDDLLIRSFAGNIDRALNLSNRGFNVIKINSSKPIPSGINIKKCLIILCGKWFDSKEFNYSPQRLLSIIRDKENKTVVVDELENFGEIESSNNLDESMKRVEEIAGVGTNPPTSKPIPEYKPLEDNQENKGIVVTLDFILDKAQAYMKGFKDALELKEQHADDELILDVIKQNVHELLECKIK